MFGVGEVHARLGVYVERVVDAGVAATHRALHDDDRTSLVDIEDRHAEDGACAVRPGGRVGDVVGADHESYVRALELGVDVVHFLELRVGHVSLGQQHVHVARHSPGHRMDCVRDVDPAGLEQVGQFAYAVLRLRDRQAVAGDDDDLAGVGELDRGVVHGDLADRAALAGHGRLRPLRRAEAADQDVADRAVHGVGHELGQDRARGTDQGTGDDQDDVADDEAGHRHRAAGEGVQH